MTKSNLFPLHILDFWDPVCLDTHLPGPVGRGEELELSTGQETLTALRTGEGGGEGVRGRRRGSGRNGRVWGGGEEVDIFINK